MTNLLCCYTHYNRGARHDMSQVHAYTCHVMYMYVCVCVCDHFQKGLAKVTQVVSKSIYYFM